LQPGEELARLDAAVSAKVLSAEEAEQLRAASIARNEAIQVDSFPHAS
jgi:hypothetical protein